MRPVHGTRARYKAGCGCKQCRAANTAYARAHLTPGADPLVLPTKARRHLRMLRKHGVGYRAVGLATDLAYATVMRIKRTRKVIRTSTEAKILAVTKDALSDGAFVPSNLTRARIAELLEEGFTKRRLARELGINGYIQFGKSPYVTARNQLKVEKLYRRYMEAA